MSLAQHRCSTKALRRPRGIARLPALRLPALLMWLALFLTALLGGTGCALTGDRNPQLQQDGVFVYPANAKAAQTQGSVRVRFDIGVDGQVRNARVESAQPPGVFDVAALAYVQGRRYLPARKDGQAVPVLGTTARIRFQLGEAVDYP